MKNYLAEIFPNPFAIGPQRAEGPIWHGQGLGTDAPGSITVGPLALGGHSSPARPTWAPCQSKGAPGHPRPQLRPLAQVLGN